MRIAIIDCGTNTFNLLIAEKTHNELTFIAEEKIPVKIGKGGIENNIIVKEAYQRAIDAMIQYASSIKKYSADKVIATSTSAFRSTQNGQDLKNDILKLTGIDVQIISGEEEAEYIYQGVTWKLPAEKDKIYLIMDIGGGSTEFILYRNENILFKDSFLLGASRLLEKFKPEDPLSIVDIKNYYDHFGTELDNTLLKVCALHPPEILVGSSGFFDTLRQITHYKFRSTEILTPNQINYEISVVEFNSIYNFMLPLNIEERLNIEGMTPFRAEMMGVSMLLVDYVLKRTSTKKMINTSYALKEGVLRKFLETGSK
jgi:exopolyphosphatase/guanosine-5'-triphosphate,3'-diphosphate pyrophosphatase